MNAVPASAPLSADAEARRALAFLADLSQTLALTLDLRETLERAVTRIADFMQAEAASLFLRDGSGRLECRVCVGPVDITGLKLDIGQGVVGRAVSENATQIVRDAQTDARVNSRVDAETGFVTRSMLCAPLSTAQGAIGALEVINRRDGGLFEQADAEILRVIAAPAALAISNATLAEGLVEQKRIKRELELARKIQKSLLPKRRRGDFPVIGVNLPAHEISGDFYDYFDLPDGRIAFLIGDVSGKGLDAAFLMVRVASLLRWSGKSAPAPGLWLASVNAELCKTLQDGRFVCAVVGQFDPRDGTVVFASAGFPPALRHDGKRFEEFLADGPPLGILDDVDYGERRLELGDDALYLFSDGATDVRDGATDVRDGTQATLGSDGLRRLIAQQADLAPEPRLRALIGELKRMRLVDDTTFLLLQRPRGKAARLVLTLDFMAQPAEMRAVRAALRGALDAEEVPPELRDQLVLVVDEACTNVMRHAYCTFCDQRITLRVSRERDMLDFQIVDDAPAIDPERVRPRELGECRAGGLGVAFMDSLMDEWRIRPRRGGKGNVLHMRKRILSGEQE